MKRMVFVLLLSAFLPTMMHASDGVVARVNGALITSRDLDAEVDRLIPQSTYHGNITAEKRNEFKSKALDDLITRELQYQDAVARGIKADTRQVAGIMDKIRERFKTKKEYTKALEEEALTEDTLRLQVEKGVIVQAAIENIVMAPSRMSEAELKDHYEKNVSKFKQPESIRLRLITIKDEKKAAEALSKIRAGADFEDVATRMSEDAFRIKGGDIGYQHRGRLLPEIEVAAFTLKPGEVSKLIKAEGFNFIIRFEDKKAEYQLSYEEVKDKLKKDLEKKRSDELREKWMTGIRSKAKIEILIKTDVQSMEDRPIEGNETVGK